MDNHCWRILRNEPRQKVNLETKITQLNKSCKPQIKGSWKKDPSSMAALFTQMLSGCFVEDSEVQ